MKNKTLGVRVGAMAAGLFGIIQCAPTLEAETFDVKIDSANFTLYTDPYNHKRIKLGGFSGLFPVPGKPDSFHVVTDRGPAPDFLDENNALFKTWAIPEFGPHLITVRLVKNGTAKIDEIKPLKRPDGVPISGLPTTIPATDVPYDFNLNHFPMTRTRSMRKASPSTRGVTSGSAKSTSPAWRWSRRMARFSCDSFPRAP